MSTRPSSSTPGRAGLVTRAASPGRISVASASKTSAVTHTEDRSAMTMTEPLESGETCWSTRTFFSTTSPPRGAETARSRCASGSTLSDRIFDSARRCATSAWRSCWSALASSFAGRARVATRARTRSNVARAASRSTPAFSRSAFSSAISGLATAKSGSPFLTRSPSSTNTFVTRPPTATPTFDARVWSMPMRAGCGSVQRWPAGSAVASLRKRHCGASAASAIRPASTARPGGLAAATGRSRS